MTKRFNDTELVTPIQGKLVTLRAFQASHIFVPEYLNWLRDKEVVRTLNIPEYLERPVELDELETYCHQLISSNNSMFIAIYNNQDDDFIGTCKLGYINWHAATADVGIMIGKKDCWGKGFASETIHILCKFAFEKMHIRKITAGAMSSNQAMIRVFQKRGFVTEGVRRQQVRLEAIYVDHILLGCMKNELR